MKKQIAIMFLLQTLDVISTHIGLTTGYIMETNPFMDLLFVNLSFFPILSIKLFLSGMIIYFGHKFFKSRLTAYLILANILMTLVVINNAVSITIVRGWTL